MKSLQAAITSERRNRAGPLRAHSYTMSLEAGECRFLLAVACAVASNFTGAELFRVFGSLNIGQS
jgi:hypothetical protein